MAVRWGKGWYVLVEGWEVEPTELREVLVELRKKLDFCSTCHGETCSTSHMYAVLYSTWP